VLAAAVRARSHHPLGVVSDITVGVRPISFWIDGNKDVVRDGEGYPVEDGNSGGDPIDALPVQISFLETPTRTSGGDPILSA
jgi:hypothetical protein